LQNRQASRQRFDQFLIRDKGLDHKEHHVVTASSGSSNTRSPAYLPRRIVANVSEIKVACYEHQSILLRVSSDPAVRCAAHPNLTNV
jgi:hypothetical protein